MKSIVIIGIVALASVSSALTVIETESAWTGAFVTNVSTGPIAYHFGESFQVPGAGDNVFAKGFLNVRTLQARTVTMGIASYTVAGSLVGSPIATQSFNLLGNGTWEQLAFDPADIGLVSGAFYALYVKATLTPVSFDIQSTVGTAYGPGGYLVGTNVPGMIANYGSDDASFRVELVPEPGSLLALGLGISVLLRRKSK